MRNYMRCILDGHGTFKPKANCRRDLRLPHGAEYSVSGGWKVLSPFKTGELLEQARVPAGLGVPGASGSGTIELFAAVMLLLPQLRRWGGLLGSALVIFFLGWIGYYYHALVGQECSCFPMIKRTIGPGFFIGDGVMLLLS